MLDEKSITDRFWQYYGKCLTERKKEYLSKCNLNCQYNTRHRVKKQGSIGFCQNPDIISKSRNPVFVCDDSDTAQNCKYFSCKNTEASVEEGFKEIIHNPSTCGHEYPKLAILIWVLQGDAMENKGIINAIRSLFQRILNG